MKRGKVLRPGTTKDEDVIGVDRNAVIQAIRAARTRAGLTQEAAAALTHHATSTISRWETGGLPNKWDDLIEYAHAMNQTIVLEFGHSPDTTKQPPPEWAGAMEQRLRLELERNRSLIEALAPEHIQRAADLVIEETAEPEQPAPEARPVSNGSEDQGAAAPPGRGLG